MSDLDFDELDKAVNTLMSDVPKVEPPKTDDVKTLTIKPTLPDTMPSSLNNLESAITQVSDNTKPKDSTPPASSSQIKNATPSSFATRRGGRFMDVVHPSSNRKPSALSTSTSTSRQGVTIEPTKSATNDRTVVEQEASVDSSQTIDNTPVVDVVTASETGSDTIQGPKQAIGNDWPDPLDMSGYDAQPESQSSNSVESTKEDATVTVDETEPDTMRPLETPFIVGTKVTKRPLGGAMTKDESPLEELDHAPVLGGLAEENTESSEAHNQLPAHPTDIETQLPPELQSDLMAIETDGDTAAPTIVSETLQPSNKDEVVRQPEQEAQPNTAVKAEAVSTLLPLKKVATPVGPTSISQQYHEEPTTSDQSNGSIYDTDAYHQPLAHPAKHSSGWLWVIWILLLLLVGGSGAMALYMLDII